MAEQEEKPKMTPEMMKNNQELAAQAALRAQQIMFRKSIGSSNTIANNNNIPAQSQLAGSPSKKSVPPVVPARGDSVLSKQPPEIPPKRHMVPPPERGGLPKQSAAPPPLPQKPSMVRRNGASNTPSGSLPGSPVLPVKAATVAPSPTAVSQNPFLNNSPQVVRKSLTNWPSAAAEHKVLQPTPKPVTAIDQLQTTSADADKYQQTPTNISRRRQMSAEADDYQQTQTNINRRTQISADEDKFQQQQQPHHQQQPIQKPSNKMNFSPVEDFSSEDALRGIESGLRNMERAMQEQMNIRSAAAARSMERGFSMDQMRLDAMNLGSMRSTLEEMKSKGFVDMNTMTAPNAPNARPIENHMKSLDRNLPLELQYSRHHHHRSQSQQEMVEQMRHNLVNSATGATAAMLSNARQSGAALSREDVRLRRRSSHDENQMSQSQANVAAGKMTKIHSIFRSSFILASLFRFQTFAIIHVRRASKTKSIFLDFFFSFSESSARTLGWNIAECVTAKITIDSDAGRLTKVKTAIWSPAFTHFPQLRHQYRLLFSSHHRYEAKRSEIETWLQRMESRLDQMGGKIGSTADVLEAQQKEQKVSVVCVPHAATVKNHWIIEFFWFPAHFVQSFHAELHQYKYHVELFNQLTQKLIAVYPSDDTSRIKRMTEAIHVR